MKAATSRRGRILDLVLAGETDVEALGQALQVSLSTVRRDLVRLALDGKLLRTYGGAAGIGVVVPEQPLDQRVAASQRQKRDIARCAAACVQVGETIILDAGPGFAGDLSVGSFHDAHRKERPSIIG